jgi:hypothetical protein
VGYTVSSSELSNMPAEDRQRALAELVAMAGAPENGQRAALEARLREFEQRYELSSADLPEALRSGRLQETADISRWLFWIEVRAAGAR